MLHKQLLQKIYKSWKKKTVLLLTTYSQFGQPIIRMWTNKFSRKREKTVPENPLGWHKSSFCSDILLNWLCLCFLKLFFAACILGIGIKVLLPNFRCLLMLVLKFPECSPRNVWTWSQSSTLIQKSVMNVTQLWALDVTKIKPWIIMDQFESEMTRRDRPQTSFGHAAAVFRRCRMLSNLDPKPS